MCGLQSDKARLLLCEHFETIRWEMMRTRARFIAFVARNNNAFAIDLAWACVTSSTLELRVPAKTTTRKGRRRAFNRCALTVLVAGTSVPAVRSKGVTSRQLARRRWRILPPMWMASRWKRSRLMEATGAQQRRPTTSGRATMRMLAAEDKRAWTASVPRGTQDHVRGYTRGRPSMPEFRRKA